MITVKFYFQDERIPFLESQFPFLPAKGQYFKFHGFKHEVIEVTFDMHRLAEVIVIKHPNYKE